jgi:hypothetical protein
MARDYSDTEWFYRVVVTKKWQSGREATYMYGPYSTPSPAKARVSTEKRREIVDNKRVVNGSVGAGIHGQVQVTCLIEKTAVDWQPA